MNYNYERINQNRVRVFIKKGFLMVLFRYIPMGIEGLKCFQKGSNLLMPIEIVTMRMEH